MMIPKHIKKKHGYIYDEKDDSPIMFEFFQSEMEKIMYQINQLRKGKLDFFEWGKIKSDLQHKIEWHKEEGEWK